MCFQDYNIPVPFFFKRKNFLGKCLVSANNSLGGLRIPLIVKCYIKGQFINDGWLINGFQGMSRDGLRKKRLQVV